MNRWKKTTDLNTFDRRVRAQENREWEEIQEMINWRNRTDRMDMDFRLRQEEAFEEFVSSAGPSESE
jgi:hypothetical protein